MSHLTWFAKQKWIQKTVGGSANALAHVPVSASVPASDNSHGLFTASADLIAYLDCNWDDFDADEGSSLNVQHILRRLLGRAQKYSNCGLPDDIGILWSLPHDILNLLRITIACAVNVYGPAEPLPSVSRNRFRMIHEVRPAWDGVKKTVRCFLIDIDTASAGNGQAHKQLVVAIRGTVARSLDWVTNLNYEARESGYIFVNDLLLFIDVEIDRQQEFPNPTGHEQVLQSPFKVHAGFSNAAKALVPLIEEQIQRCRSRSIDHIIFTGHSAGGAVASLMYMYVLGQAQARYSEFCFSLITFGAPPVTTQPVTSCLDRIQALRERPGFAMAVVNEHDPISRADSGYVKSMINLYNQDRCLGLADGGTAAQHWNLPEPDLHILGHLLVLKESKTSVNEEILMYRVEARDFNKLLFCDRPMHSKLEYLERIQNLASGSGDGGGSGQNF